MTTSFIQNEDWKKNDVVLVKASLFWTEKVIIWWFFGDTFRAWGAHEKIQDRCNFKLFGLRSSFALLAWHTRFDDLQVVLDFISFLIVKWFLKEFGKKLWTNIEFYLQSNFVIL